MGFPTSSAYNMPSFEAGAQLLSNLSGYAYTKRAWRKEVFELFMDPLFFTMDASCALRLVCLFVCLCVTRRVSEGILLIDLPNGLGVLT